VNLQGDDTPSTSPAGTLPVPDAAAQALAGKKIGEVFPNVERLPQVERSPTAIKMVDAADGMKDDPSTMYVLLKEAGALAASAGDGDTSLKAASILDKTFAGDSDELVIEWFRKASSMQLPANGSEELVDAILTFANTAADKQKFDVMARALTAAAMAARNAQDTSLRAVVQDHAAELKQLQSESIRAKSAEAVLAKNPEDPQANYVVGCFRCFAMDDWKSGLPDLAKSSSPAYRQAAAAELASPEESTKQIAVGDLWWDLGAKEVGRTKMAVQRHALDCYNKARASPDLNGLERTKIETRIKSFAALEKTVTENGRWVDLMRLIDLKLDAKSGTWKMENGALTSGADNGERVQIPYVPPEEYDYRVVFAMKGSGTQAVQFASSGGRGMVWDIGRGGNTAFTLNDKAAGRTFSGLQVGKRYTSVIKVRRGYVQFFLDNQLMLTESSPDLLFETGLWYGLEDKRLLGIGSLFSPMSFVRIDVQEISGHGNVLRR